MEKSSAWNSYPQALDQLDDPIHPGIGRYRVEYTKVDVLSVRRTVHDEQASNAVVSDERLQASLAVQAIVMTAALSTPPALSLYVHVTPAARGDGLRDLVALSPCADGKRVWIVLLVLTINLFAAHSLARRSALGLRWSWFAILLAAGPVVLLLPPLIEPPPRRERPSRPLRSPLRPRIVGQLASVRAQA